MPEQHDRTTAVESRSDRLELARRCRRVTEARWFALTVLAVILLNAALLGLETYSGLVAEWHRWLRLAEHACLAVFTVEILLRLGAHADRPRNFCKDPWNLFDLAVVLCAFLPFVRENTTVLRLLRLARVLRTARFLPQLRIVLVAVGRSLPGTLSFLLVGALLLYVYAMVGWVFFGHQDPEHYGSIGRAVLTLFLLMILDGIGDAIHAGLEISRWSLLYYASYVLLASFVLVNVLVGVVITSLEEAREMEREEEPPEVPDPTPVPEDQRLLLERVTAARRALDALERDLTATALPPTADHPRRDLAEEGAPS
ncbi:MULTISPECIES: ion transporter [unclassified Streptomyces]|uniref:ion transporter n=1 Tax=unclassified Streptomyces TaxID=2593676 RepID=UPI00081BB0F1|nr:MULTISPECIES: ion transporter [unclassified Streptomyces]MYQ51118.1 ion transporter [Streptomyces sp. SID4941]SCD54489.1 voltage-gated sodium channel [Streptomyces sp. PalvLS-984]SDD89996.1 voltage-gated sodium channel [Streptomyces sp. AmelKG-A3]